MGTWTNPNVNQITSLAQTGSLTGTPALTLTPGTTYQPVVLANVASFTSYDLNMYGYASPAGNAGNVLVIPVTLQWFDDLTSGIPVFEEDWWIWAGRAAPVSNTSYMAASGPMHGQYLTVTVGNNGGVGSNLIIQYFNMFGSNRSVPYSDWRQNAQSVNPETNGIATLAGESFSDAFDNVLLGLDEVAVGANGQVWAPLGLYAGPVSIRLRLETTPAHNFVFASTEGLESGSLLAVGTTCPGIVYSAAGTLATEYNATIIAPRAPLAFTVQAPAAGTTISCRVVGQQAA